MAWRVTKHRPRYLKSELVRTYAGESPDYYDVEKNKWFNTNSGSELVTNGTFSIDVAGWSSGTDVTAVWESGKLKLQSTTTASSDGVKQTLTTIVGKKYRLKFYYIAGTRALTLLYINNALILSNTVSGNVEYDFVAQSTSTIINFSLGTAATTYDYIDNVSCFPIEITPTTEITESRNYMNHIVHADNDGGVLYVEELPKIEYKDIIKANEFKGKNACTAWVNFDGTTTPPTIRDSFNVSSVARTGTGVFDIYFATPMDTTNYVTTGLVEISGGNDDMMLSGQLTNKVTIRTTNNTPSFINYAVNTVLIFGGKN